MLDVLLQECVIADCVCVWERERQRVLERWIDEGALTKKCYIRYHVSIPPICPSAPDLHISEYGVQRQEQPAEGGADQKGKPAEWQNCVSDLAKLQMYGMWKCSGVLWWWSFEI